MRSDRGGIGLWEVEGTHSSLGKNPPTTKLPQDRINTGWHTILTEAEARQGSASPVAQVVTS